MPVDDAQQLARRLTTAYRQAWQEVQAEQARLADLRLWRPEVRGAVRARRARFAQIQARIEQLMADVDRQARQWIQQEFPSTYEMGAREGATLAGREWEGWTQVHVEAVTAHALDLYDDLLAATENVTRTSKRLIRRLAKRRVTVDQVVGETARTTARKLAKELREHRIYAVRYKDGSLHGIGEYAEVAVRTKTAVAFNNGTIAGSGSQWFRVLDGPKCGWAEHDDTQSALNMIVSRDDALAYPIAHPNCRRAFAPAGEARTAEEAARLIPPVDEGQIASQLAQDATGAQFTQADRGRRVARAQRATRAVRPTPRRRS